MTVLITGAQGFVGRALVQRIGNTALPVVATARRLPTEFDHGTNVSWRRHPSAGHPGAPPSAQQLDELIDGADTIIHLAARVHFPKGKRPTRHSYRRHNLELTQMLATAAMRTGTRHFIYVSSIKAMGGASRPGIDGAVKPFVESDFNDPSDEYGKSKLAAEDTLRQLANEGRLTVTIVRPCLVYGPGVLGNIDKLIRWIDRRMPLPLYPEPNARSLIYRDNLADLLIAIAAQGVDVQPDPQSLYLAADRDVVSTADLAERIAGLLGRKLRPISAEGKIVRKMSQWFNREDDLTRFSESLVVDPTRAEETFNWRGEVSLDEGLERTVAAYMERRDSKTPELKTAS